MVKEKYPAVDEVLDRYAVRIRRVYYPVYLPFEGGAPLEESPIISPLFVDDVLYRYLLLICIKKMGRKFT